MTRKQLIKMLTKLPDSFKIKCEIVSDFYEAEKYNICGKGITYDEEKREIILTLKK